MSYVQMEVEVDMWTVRRDGVISLTKTGRMANYCDDRGHMAVSYGNKVVRVSALMSRAFLGDLGHIVGHKDGDTNNCALENLEYRSKSGKKVILEKDGQRIEFNSQTACSTHFGVNKNILGRYLRQGVLPPACVGWSLVV